WEMPLSGPHVEWATETGALTFTFSNNNWLYLNSPSQSTPTLPVSEPFSLRGVGTGYGKNSPVVYCFGPEANRATPLPEVDGTIEGFCRAAGDSPTIGPQMAQSTACDI